MAICKFQKEYPFFIIPLIMVLFTWVCIPPYENQRIPEIGPLLSLICIWLWVQIFKSPYKIFINGEKITFFTLSGKFEITTHQVNSYDDGTFFFFIKSKNKRIWVSTLMDNISALKHTIKLIKGVKDISTESQGISYWHIMFLVIYFSIAIWWFNFR